MRDIEKLHKKPKADKETRLATALVKELSLLYTGAPVQAVFGFHAVLIKHGGLENRVHSFSRCINNNACKHVSAVSPTSVLALKNELLVNSICLLTSLDLI